MKYNIIEIIKILTKKNYKIFSNPYSLNLIGIRAANPIVDRFNDILSTFYMYDGKLDYREFVVTTLPGLYYLEKPMNSNGCAIVKEGQYQGMWAIGKHFTQTALVQVKPCTVIRDDDKDDVYDFENGKEETGIFAINCHRKEAPGISEFISQSSAGCTVMADHDRFDKEFMPLCQTCANVCGNSFTYTLINEKDFL